MFYPQIQTEQLRKFTQFLALGVLLIGAPIGSWYYLNKGFNERKEALDQLRDYGKFQLTSTTDVEGHPVTEDSLQQRFSVVGFLDNISKESAELKHAELLYKQFGRDGGIALVTYMNAVDSTNLQSYATEVFSKQDGFWYIVNLSKERYNTMRNQIYGDSLRSGSHFALIDTTLTIRNYYDATDIKAVDALAKHVAMFVAPTKARPDFIFRREKEK